jgi:hypothetical protein
MTKVTVRCHVSLWLLTEFQAEKLDEQVDGYLKELGYGA